MQKNISGLFHNPYSEWLKQNRKKGVLFIFKGKEKRYLLIHLLIGVELALDEIREVQNVL